MPEPLPVIAEREQVGMLHRTELWPLFPLLAVHLRQYPGIKGVIVAEDHTFGWKVYDVDALNLTDPNPQNWPVYDVYPSVYDVIEEGWQVDETLPIYDLEDAQ